MGMSHHVVLGGCPLCMIWIVLSCTLRDSHRVLSTILLQFDYCIMNSGMMLVPRCVGWIAHHFDYLESC
jgi:hypothetical protein